MKPYPTAARRPARGFTLVELLVVITIIVVLAAITFTVTGRVRDQAVTATDTGKFRQVGIALQSITPFSPPPVRPPALLTTPFSPPSGQATGSFNGLHTESKFLAASRSSSLI